MFRFIRVPLMFIIFIWAIFIGNTIFNLQLNRYGIYPRSINGLVGIFCSPFLHANLQHIISNTAALFVLLCLLFIFYRKNAWTIIFLSILLGGFLVWLFGRQVYHIGASGLIYSLAAYLICAGIFNFNLKSLLIAVIVTVLYGGLAFGVLPIHQGVSWESHLFSAVAGVFIAYILRAKKVAEQ